MNPYGAMPVDPTGPNQPNWVETDDPTVRAEEYRHEPKHGTPTNIVAHTSEFNDVPVTLLAGNIGFQQATPEHPLLPPMHMRRSALANVRAEGGIMEEIYEKLLKKLPPKLQKKLKRQKRQGMEERQPHWAAFDESLQFMAATLSFLSELGNVQRKKEGLPDQEEFMELWIQAMDEQGQAYLDAGQEYLSQLDAGTPDRDLISQLLSELSGSLQQLHDQHRVEHG